MFPRRPGPLGDAKLVSPPPVFPAAVKPPPNPAKPPPSDANPEVPVDAKGDAVLFAAKPVADPAVSMFGEAALNTEVVELPIVPNGEVSEPAKAAKLDVANAEVAAGVSVRGTLSSAAHDDLEDPSEPNGETADVFAKALVIDG